MGISCPLPVKKQAFCHSGLDPLSYTSARIAQPPSASFATCVKRESTLSQTSHFYLIPPLSCSIPRTDDWRDILLSAALFTMTIRVNCLASSSSYLNNLHVFHAQFALVSFTSLSYHNYRIDD